MGKQDLLGIRFAYDKPTYAVKQLDYDHGELHEGKHYTFSERNTLNSGVQRNILMVVPDDKYIHFVWSFVTTGAATIDVFKQCTPSGSGTLITGHTYNNNDNYANDTNVLFYANPTDPGGIQYYWGNAGAGGVPVSQAQGSSSRSDNERVSKAGYKYLFKITSNADSNVISFKVAWYEEGDEFEVHSSSSMSTASESSPSVSSTSTSSSQSASSNSSSSTSTSGSSSSSSWSTSSGSSVSESSGSSRTSSSASNSSSLGSSDSTTSTSGSNSSTTTSSQSASSTSTSISSSGSSNSSSSGSSGSSSSGSSLTSSTGSTSTGSSESSSSTISVSGSSSSSS